MAAVGQPDVRVPLWQLRCPRPVRELQDRPPSVVDELRLERRARRRRRLRGAALAVEVEPVVHQLAGHRDQRVAQLRRDGERRLEARLRQPKLRRLARRPVRQRPLRPVRPPPRGRRGPRVAELLVDEVRLEPRRAQHDGARPLAHGAEVRAVGQGVQLEERLEHHHLERLRQRLAPLDRPQKAPDRRQRAPLVLAQLPLGRHEVEPPVEGLERRRVQPLPRQLADQRPRPTQRDVVAERPHHRVARPGGQEPPQQILGLERDVHAAARRQHGLGALVEPRAHRHRPRRPAPEVHQRPHPVQKHPVVTDEVDDRQAVFPRRPPQPTPELLQEDDRRLGRSQHDDAVQRW